MLSKSHGGLVGRFSEQRFLGSRRIVQLGCSTLDFANGFGTNDIPQNQQKPVSAKLRK
jgi:hypothetical protein